MPYEPLPASVLFGPLLESITLEGLVFINESGRGLRHDTKDDRCWRMEIAWIKETGLKFEISHGPAGPWLQRLVGRFLHTALKVNARQTTQRFRKQRGINSRP